MNEAVVIGAGFGGLAAALRLRARGYAVTLVEANSWLGGRAGVYHQDGFVFDAGPTVITAPYLLEELFELHGERLSDHIDLVPVDPFYRVEFADGSRFDYVGDEARLLANIEAISPSDVDGYRRLAAHSREIFDVGYSELAHVPFDRLTTMLRASADMVRLKNHRSVYRAVSEYIRDPRLRQAFTFQPLLIGGNPFRASSIYLLIHWLERRWGVHFAMGGTNALVRALGALCERVGIEIRLDEPVESILVRDGVVKGVKTSRGERRADVVVANSDPTIVFRDLIDARHLSLRTRLDARRMRQSMSLVVVYLGVRKTWPELAHHTILLGPRYRELLEDIFDRRVLAEDFSLYLHAPTRTDPSLAPPGCENLYVLSPVPNLRAGLDWETIHARYVERIIDHLDARYLPGLRENIVTRHSVDPRFFAGPLRSAEGAAFGPEPRLTQSAYFRYHNRSGDVAGLYFAGAGTHPGGGIPGVLTSAKVLDRVVPDPS